MKYKLLIFLIITTIITFIIFKYNYKNNILITSINSLDKDNNYNIQLVTKINELLPTANINIDYSDESIEIENLITLIKENNNNIQSIIHDSKVIIISIGNNDVEKEKVKTILNEYKELFKLLRKYNNKQIIFISPINFKYQSELKEIAVTHKINYINTISYISPYIINNKINDEGKNYLINIILNKIPYIKQ